MEYLKKSDVMAVFTGPVPLIDALPVTRIPDPSLAVDGDAISRKGLKDEILSQYPEITVEWDAAFNALLRIINSMPALPPAPSVDDGKPANNKEIPNSTVDARLYTVPTPESGNSKLLEMIAKAEWLNVKVVNPKELAMNVCFIRDSIAEVCNGMREIARLLAKRGDK